MRNVLRRLIQRNIATAEELGFTDDVSAWDRRDGVLTDEQLELRAGVLIVANDSLRRDLSAAQRDA